MSILLKIVPIIGLVLFWSHLCFGAASDNTTVVQPKTVEAQTKTNEDQDKLMDGQNKTIRCYVSQGPISKDDLTDFFADPKNQKDCAENITQCQHTIANHGLNGYGFKCGTDETMKSFNHTFTDKDAKKKNPFKLTIGQNTETHYCGEDLCNKCLDEDDRNSGLSLKIIYRFFFVTILIILID